ncbi:MAG TPA: sialidase family protein [Streptosporangiaceae bacterium]|nr:sialidase family protein [Streptosporangiaceae bacterium]
MSGNFDGEGSQPRAGAMNSLQVSRRDFLGGVLAASSLLVAGLPLQACTAVGEPTHTGSRVTGNSLRGILNVQVSHDGPRHTEPCLAVNPRNPRNLLAVSMSVLGTYVSFDGGLTWRSGGALRLPPDSGGGNVSAAFDSAGRGFVCGLFGSAGGGQTSVLVWRTEDGGRTFTPPAVVGQGANLDRPWLATDRHWPGVVHIAWSQGTSADLATGLTTGLRYARSTNGGRTFDAPRTITSRTTGLGNPMVACGPPGTVYILYSEGTGAAGNAPADTPSTVTVVCSHDQGQTFRPPIALGRSTDFLSFPGLRGGTGSSLPAIAAHPGRGLVCAAFTDHAAGASRVGVLLTASQDAGRTWSRATAVTPQDQVTYFQPEVAIDDASRIGVMAFAMNQGKASVMLTISEPGSLRFGPPIKVTDQPFDPAKVNYQLGDYQALATTPGAFHPLWNDTRTGQLQLFTAAVPVRG